MVAAGLALLCACSAQTKPATSFDSKEAWSYLLKQCEFGPRKPGTEPHVKCRDYLTAELGKYCDNAHLQPFKHTWSQTGQSLPMWNVVGDQNWDRAEIRVALFAHWDTRPTADMEASPTKQKQPIPGANDGASGVAVLIELAKVLKGKLPANVGVQYVLIDGEDLGPDSSEMYLGAVLYGKNMPTKRPNYGILLDMIGGKNLVVPKEPNGERFAPTLLTELYRFADSIGLGTSFPDRTGPEIEDDHWALFQYGKLPTIDLIDFDYPAWHTLSDTPENCSAESLGKVGTLLEAWLKKPTPFKL